jgi:hypothetical protein
VDDVQQRITCRRSGNRRTQFVAHRRRAERDAAVLVRGDAWSARRHITVTATPDGGRRVATDHAQRRGTRRRGEGQHDRENGCSKHVDARSLTKQDRDQSGVRRSRRIPFSLRCFFQTALGDFPHGWRKIPRVDKGKRPAAPIPEATRTRGGWRAGQSLAERLRPFAEMAFLDWDDSDVPSCNAYSRTDRRRASSVHSLFDRLGLDGSKSIQVTFN